MISCNFDQGLIYYIAEELHMRYLYTGQDARKIDDHATMIVGIPSMVLMERAAMSAAKLIMERESRDRWILAVCGTGNNGGDGVATARILHEMGYNVAVTIVGYPDSMSKETKKQVEIAIGSHVPIIPMSSIHDREFDVVIDALFGIGLSRDVSDVYEDIIADIDDGDHYVYSLDIPSGINSGNGAVMGIALHAGTTITFGVNKLGLVLYPGCEYAGEVVVCDIGIPGSSADSLTPPYFYYEPADIGKLLPFRKPRSHKGSFGHVLVVAGSKNMCGAAYLAACAAFKSGAGMVKVISDPDNRDVIFTKLPEALFGSYDDLESELDWADVIVIGPGLGLEGDSQELVRFVVENSPVPTVIDGDGIRLCRNVTSKLSENFIVTPHMKELSYLNGLSVEDILKEPVSAAYDTAMDIDGIVVAKDARTIVSDGDSCYINVSGNNGMATAGSGDVLAGLIGGLLAQGMLPFRAACLGVYIHGLAGDIMAQRLSRNSLMAGDLLTGISEVIREGTIGDAQR
ncbi:MAG TPA: bifunctional ADP-dependent NAD(P)H-hydrate dehydratase/NAD(P)H-hydrate epimerase [Lachnospiraceae bacterium]|nr:bifunctional ADP-dependent NAD(P)H-hydrate dehydratase/NAD(P)H-hydrate epimerase [Lachnospiraceae bacterium]